MTSILGGRKNSHLALRQGRALLDAGGHHLGVRRLGRQGQRSDEAGQFEQLHQHLVVVALAVAGACGDQRGAGTRRDGRGCDVDGLLLIDACNAPDLSIITLHNPWVSDHTH